MDNNICGDIELILANIPDNLTDLEKVRWVYINLGKLFSYDLKVLDNKEIYKKDINYQRGITTYVNRFQTCKQISQIFISILKELNIKANLIERTIIGRHYADNHIAIETTVDGEKYLMDLTLDLYLIQSGCQTKEFGYSNNSDGDYNIIPLSDDKQIDSKLGLLKDDYYTDEIIKKLVNINNLTDKLSIITSEFKQFFEGAHEALLFYKKVFIESLTNEELENFKTYNLYYIDEEYINFCSVFVFSDNLMYLYDKYLGFVITDNNKINAMLNNGFKTNSNTLKQKCI